MPVGIAEQSGERPRARCASAAAVAFWQPRVRLAESRRGWRLTRLPAPPVLIFALVLALAACGGGDAPGDSGAGGTSGTPEAGATAPPPGRYFPDGPWYQDVTNAALDP